MPPNIAWKIHWPADGGKDGYKVMSAQLKDVGVYDLAGAKVDPPGDYEITDRGDDPTIGVPHPPWFNSIPIPVV